MRKMNHPWSPMDEESGLWRIPKDLEEPQWVPADQPTGNDPPGSWRALQHWFT
jgi:hypothetical protein